MTKSASTRAYWVMKGDEQSQQILREHVQAYEYTSLFSRPFLCRSAQNSNEVVIETYNDEQALKLKLAVGDLILRGPIR